ncbi:MAG: type IX secretion system sortase PorU [Paludibacteraceae bacterium]|nr:type IX secretion system sortase PorU [Paludibacteraceae bacterium]
MKKLTNILIGLLWVATSMAANVFAERSVLRQGTWIKIRIAESGIYCLTYDELKTMGLQKPENVRIYGYGGAMLSQNFSKPMIDDVPAVGFYMEKGEDGVFGKGDYILFYGQGSFRWAYDGKSFAHTRNPYSDHGYYFLSDNAGEQKLLIGKELPAYTAYTRVETYTYLAVHEQDSINLIDPSSGEDGGGREFYGERLNNNKRQLTIDFNVSNIQADKKIFCRADVAAAAEQRTTFALTLNGKERKFYTSPIAVSDFYTKATTCQDTGSYPATNSTRQQVKLTYSCPVNGKGWLNYIEIAAGSKLQLVGDYMSFRTAEGYNKSTRLLYYVKGSDANTQIWNITDLSNITCEASKLQHDTLVVSGNNNNSVQEYIAVNTHGSHWLKPQKVGTIDNQNLHALAHIDYVIISPKEFVTEAKRLAQAHAEKEGITWAVVTDQQVYNEFSSGTPDATAYRRFMKMLYDRAEDEADQPKWLLLMGDGTFDNRKLLATSGKNTLLTYQAANSTVETKAYATDDYFAYMSESAYSVNEVKENDDNQMAFGVGRLPVESSEEAKRVVDKVIRYLNNRETGKWKQQLAFLADDGDNGLHTQVAEEGAEKVMKKNPDFIINKIYLDAYPQEVNASGESYPLAKNRLDNLLKNGILFMNYSGHGGYNAITNESMMDLKSIRNMNNSHLGFWMLATCSFSHFDSNKRCAAEEAILNPNGGAIGVMSACRTVYASQNTVINRNFCDTLFGHKDIYTYDMTIGQATRIAKNLTTDANKLPYILLGDPALRLNYPTTYHVETQPVKDTVRALTTQTIHGVVKSSPNDTAYDFNGHVDITIYDKMQRLTTRDNDEPDPEKQIEINYNDYPNIIFSGRTKVEDGKFSYTFMAPKDIRYNFGNGRIVYYAYDTLTLEDGIGHYHDFTIGGSNLVTIQDTVGPQMKLYLNTPAFRSGDETYETPRFFADLYDEHGINTVGSGIGHDLMLMIDNDPKQSYVLNEYFAGENNSYTKGQVSYALSELKEGAHTLTFRAWDLLNNSNTQRLDFSVVKGLDPQIYSVTSYPNPAKENDVMRFVIQYDQPDMLTETGLFVYDLSGHLVWHQAETNTQEMNINLQEIGLNAGIYVYNIQIQSQTGKNVSRAGKIIITR